MSAPKEIGGVGLLLITDRLLRPLELFAAIFAAAVLGLTMTLISLDALLRYVFNSPLKFQYTLTEDYLLVAVIALALPWGFRTGGYIRVNALASFIPKMANRLLIRAGLLASAVYMAVLSWKSAQHFFKLLAADQIKIGLIDWPVHYSWIWIPIGCGMLSLRLLLTALSKNSSHDPREI